MTASTGAHDAPAGGAHAEPPHPIVEAIAAQRRRGSRRFRIAFVLTWAVIIGGAGLAGMAAQLQPLVDVPLIDSVAAGVRHALRPSANAPSGASGRFDVAWQNLSDELTARGLPSS